MPSTLALVALLAGFSALHWRRQRYVLQLGVWFNACAAAYMVFGMWVARNTMEPYYGVELEQIGWMCIAAVIGFNVAYLVAGWQRPGLGERSGQGRAICREDILPSLRAARRVPDAPSRSAGTLDPFLPKPRSRRSSTADYLPSYTSILVVVAVGFAFEAAAVLLIGPLDFVFSDRLQRFALVQGHQALFYLANLMNVCLPIVLARYLRFGQRRDLAMLAVLVGHGVLLALLTISRYDLALVLLVGGYFLERHGRIGPVALVSVLTIAFVTTLFYKPMLYGALLSQPYATDVDYSEYTNWIRHTLLLLTRPDVEMPHDGYALALKSLFVVSPEQDSLAEWFFKEFFPERVILFPGAGYGFSGVWEGYSANGLLGVATHFAAFGALFGLLERSPSAMRHVLIVFAMVLTYRLFRSEAYNFVKTYAWFFVYPTLAIVVVDKFLLWASGPGAAGAPPRRGSKIASPGRVPH